MRAYTCIVCGATKEEAVEKTEHACQKTVTKAMAKTVTIKKNKTTSKAITGLKAGGKYYVRIRTCKTVSGKKYCSDRSAAKDATAKK